MSQQAPPDTESSVPVVSLADEFGVSMAEMLAICDRLGCDVAGDHTIDSDSALRVRTVVQLQGPRAALGKRPLQPSTPIARPVAALPELGSVSHDTVRTRAVLAIALIIISIASVLGVLVDRFVEGRDSSPAPAAAVLHSFGGVR